MSFEKANYDELSKVLSYISKDYDVPKIIYDVVMEVAKREVEEKKKLVIIKRDPNIHRNRIQAAYVKVIEDNAVNICPITVPGYGADFDGDTMSLFSVISKESQKELGKLVSIDSCEGIGAQNNSLTLEMLTGIFLLTNEKQDNPPKHISDIKELDELHPGTMINILFRNERVINTAGRVLFNSFLPPYISFVNKDVGKKEVAQILSEIILKSKEDYVRTINGLMRLGFHYATMYPRTVDLELLTNIPPELVKLREDLSKEKDLMKQQEIINTMTKKLVEHLKNEVPILYQQIASGAAKGDDQIRQIMVAKGLVADGEGVILPPIAKAMNDGYNPSEYFAAGPGSRRGIISRVHHTASGGYAYRKNIFATGNAQADINRADCGTKRTLNIKLTPELFKRMKGRYIQEKDGTIKPVTANMIGKIIPLRSPIFCKTERICRLCYGDLLLQLDSRNVGIIASMEVASLSERIMKCSVGTVIQSKNNNIYSFEDLWENN